MKVTITADIHLGYPGRLDDCIWALEQILQYNIDNGIDNWIIAGDLYHDRETLDIKCLNKSFEFFEKAINDHGQTIHVFPGNHDMYMKNSWEVNSLKPMAHLFNYYDTVTKFELGGQLFYVVPFIHSESKYMKVIDKISDMCNEDDVLLTHIGVKSATLNTCFLLKSWSVVDFSNTNFHRVYTGHFHCHQQVGDKVWYTGSPIPFSFDEGDIDHGFLVYDTEKKDHEFVSIWYQNSDEVPQYVTINDDSIEEDKVKNNVVRIKLGKEHTQNELAKIKKKLIDQGAKSVRFMHSYGKEDEQVVDKTNAKISDPQKLFETFVENDKNAEELDRNILLKLNSKIMAEGDRIYHEEYHE